ncbi:hypothetical protein DSCO28_09300 [Desulfosarcina ovata subsp. sediminis]|uniref:Co-chaperone DjlA N-terminal domain-containing protein n=1 Tax=Desulfosarcina ovata subsp. sediminis TaxID=885957 RepID=A0A5K7ZGA3_9BACT|nr:TerB family tellurite resistance protein [Desulfosarcina ovata]BBO80364.1 hypothetical protein DSCO28_09300 [Desulfosarcina ovata subsp. sediminis]
MISVLKRFLNGTAGGGNTVRTNSERDVTIAVCALFVEMGRIDGTFSEAETNRVISILTGKYELDRQDVDALIAEAKQALEESVDLWQFARVINENFSNEKKEKLIERLWQVVYVDGRMDQHEHYLMNKLSHLLRLSHQQLIDTKMKVLHGE